MPAITILVMVLECFAQFHMTITLKKYGKTTGNALQILFAREVKSGSNLASRENSHVIV